MSLPAHLIKRHLGSGKTAAWLLIIIIVPFVGACLYWMLRRPDANEAQRLYDNERAMRESAHRRPVDSSYIGP